jgi:D-glycero-alpha-D-manno-heptose-7-phosphate kinase
MLVVRTPYRVPLGGGGTDLPSYYSKYGGFLITAAINKYIYVMIGKRFENNIRVSHYKAIEIKDQVNEIEHPVIRESLRLLNVNDGIEIVSIADIPPNTGLGSSGSFTVGLLTALHAYKNDHVSPKEVAEEACKIEIDILKRAGGKQDQYIAAFGGIICLTIDKNGNVEVTRPPISEGTVADFESHILYFYSGVKRDAPEVQRGQDAATKRNDVQVVEALHRIKEIGEESKLALEKGDIRRFGRLLNEHWQVKKQLSGEITTSYIDRIYKLAMENGALGGKIMGAGGGGFFMFCCEEETRERICQALQAEGLQEFKFKINSRGSTIMANSFSGDQFASE